LLLPTVLVFPFLFLIFSGFFDLYLQIGEASFFISVYPFDFIIDNK